jgi:hypothetical protein
VWWFGPLWPYACNISGHNTLSKRKYSEPERTRRVLRKKEIVMNRISAIALIVAASFVTAGSAMAQDHRAQATVPFNFSVNGNSLPAGTYTIGSEVNSPNLITITDREKNVHLMTIVVPDSNTSSAANKLVFHRYGDQYFLSEVRCDSASMNVQLSTSKAEKRAKTAQTQQAGLRVNTDVMIALNN